MPKDIPIGNGNLLIAFGKDGLLREFCFPQVGEENHAMGEPFRFGVSVDGAFSWIPDGWGVEQNYLDDTLVTDVRFTSEQFGLCIQVHDAVDFQENIYIRQIVVKNLTGEKKEVRLFLGQDFHIYGNSIGDTAAYRPDVRSILHYKRERHFLINIWANGKWGIDLFATGNKESKGREGAWRDAEDGELGGNPIAQGSVDSVIGIPLTVEPGAEESCYYWIAVGKNWEEVKTLNDCVLKTTPAEILRRTKDYWHLWADKECLNYALLPEKVAWAYKRSLLIGRTQINNSGSIIAANDSDVIHFNLDTYSYMWMRDGALIAHAFDLASHSSTVDFYNLCAKIIEKEGCFLHKYTPSGALASSWHPWIQDHVPQLPIQEDGTALVLWALWQHYALFQDIEFIRPLYRSLIIKAADFMMNYRDVETGLPLPSFDLWEERRGVLTFTTAAVFGGLVAAAHFADAFGDVDLAEGYRQGAQKMREGMDRYLYLDNEKRFARMVNFKRDGSIEVDSAIDASAYGVFAFGAYEPDDPRVASTMAQIYETLWLKTPVGGLARYEGDDYYRQSPDVPGNPWFITTLWMAQYYIAIAKSKDDLSHAAEILQWVADHALPSGVLAEQIHPYTHEPLSVSPLTWSHGGYILTVQKYIDKLVELEKCPECGMSKHLKKRKVL